MNKRAKEKRRLKHTVLGMILLGLWGMLALLLGTSAGMESNYHRTLSLDLQPGFGETHATRHPRNEDVNGYAPNGLPPLCLDKDCPGTDQLANSGYPGPHRDDVPGDEVDDATSAIGRPHGPETPPTFTQGHSSDPVPNWLFVPGGGENPDGPGTGNPIPGGPDIDNPPQNPGAPPDFTQPPFSNPPGPDGPGGDVPDGPDSPQGPDGPSGPDGPPNGQPDPPQQLPEPLTFSLFAGGLAGAILLRRRRNRAPK